MRAMSTTLMKTLAGLALALAISACGGSDTSASATAPSVVTGPVTALFEGKLDPGGFAFYSFTVTTTGLTSQLVNSLTPGTYCTRLYDIGNLRSTVNFAVRIVHT